MRVEVPVLVLAPRTVQVLAPAPAILLQIPLVMGAPALARPLPLMLVARLIQAVAAPYNVMAVAVELPAQLLPTLPVTATPAARHQIPADLVPRAPLTVPALAPAVGAHPCLPIMAVLVVGRSVLTREV